VITRRLSCSTQTAFIKQLSTTSWRGRATQSRCHNAQASLITMLSTVPLNAGRRRVFGSVFSPASLEARPPFASSVNHDQTPFSSFQSDSSSSTVKSISQTTVCSPAQEQSADRQAWDQAWSASTAFLSVPNHGFAPIYESRETDGGEALKELNRLSPPSKETGEALAYLTTAAQNTRSTSRATGPKDLFSWYGDEIRRHFLMNLRSGLYEVCT
jgi:anaphase-promoting complex subunit 2